MNHTKWEQSGLSQEDIDNGHTERWELIDHTMRPPQVLDVCYDKDELKIRYMISNIIPAYGPDFPPPTGLTGFHE